MSLRARDFQIGQIVRLIDNKDEPDYVGEGLIGRLGKVTGHSSDSDRNYLILAYLRPDRKDIDPFAYNVEPIDDCEDELVAQQMLDELSR